MPRLYAYVRVAQSGDSRSEHPRTPAPHTPRGASRDFPSAAPKGEVSDAYRATPKTAAAPKVAAAPNAAATTTREGEPSSDFFDADAVDASSAPYAPVASE